MSLCLWFNSTVCAIDQLDRFRGLFSGQWSMEAKRQVESTTPSRHIQTATYSIQPQHPAAVRQSPRTSGRVCCGFCISVLPFCLHKAAVVV